MAFAAADIGKAGIGAFPAAGDGTFTVLTPWHMVACGPGPLTPGGDSGIGGGILMFRHRQSGCLTPKYAQIC
jgi:hypothetical protein